MTVFFVGEYVDLLLECAENYKKLLSYEYHFKIARKSLVREFVLSFQKSDVQDVFFKIKNRLFFWSAKIHIA